jgi:hypothetical protein
LIAGHPAVFKTPSIPRRHAAAEIRIVEARFQDIVARKVPRRYRNDCRRASRPFAAIDALTGRAMDRFPPI